MLWVLSIRFVTLWIMTPYSLVGEYQCCGRSYRPLLLEREVQGNTGLIEQLLYVVRSSCKVS